MSNLSQPLGLAMELEAFLDSHPNPDVANLDLLRRTLTELKRIDEAAADQQRIDAERLADLLMKSDRLRSKDARATIRFADYCIQTALADALSVEIRAILARYRKDPA